MGWEPLRASFSGREAGFKSRDDSSADRRPKEEIDGEWNVAYGHCVGGWWPQGFGQIEGGWNWFRPFPDRGETIKHCLTAAERDLPDLTLHSATKPHRVAHRVAVKRDDAARNAAARNDMDGRSSYAFRLLLVLVTAIVAWQCAVYAIGPVIPRARLDMIQEGMSKDEVVRILGEPAVRGPEYIYEKPFNPGYVQIAFDPGGRVRYVNDESVFR